MPTAIVTGSGGLVGSESVRSLVEAGYQVVGIENDMRSSFFGAQASTAHVTSELVDAYPEFRSLNLDIRDADSISRVFAKHRGQTELVIHAAAQPSHDWAAREPHTDFSVNAVGTLNLLEGTREHAPDATFAFISTNKVYGDTPNHLHGADLAEACLIFHRNPRAAAVYNFGGGRESNCSMLEPIVACERISGRRLERSLSDVARIGDHRWWISDLGEFTADYPDWQPRYDVDAMLQQIHDRNVERWTAVSA